MLKQSLWYLRRADDLEIELLQSRDEGKDVRSYEERVTSIQSMDPDDPQREIEAAEVCDELAALPVMEGYAYEEPSDLNGIKAARPEAGKNAKLNTSGLDDDRIFDKVYGVWLGRCAGCLLGQPIEGWGRNRINDLLKDTGNYPFKYYVSSAVSEEIRKKYDIVDRIRMYGAESLKNWINNVKHAPEDDDTNYTLIGLKILEQYGPDFTPDDVAESWLANLPVFHLCTAERIAYRNILNLILPPASAIYRNPYREWIGAQIRADFFGYVTPGNPERAAEMAWRDASISHIKNGIYGEMFVAAMLAAAAATDDIEKIINCGISQIPEKSRLAEKIRWVLGWKKRRA